MSYRVLFLVLQVLAIVILVEWFYLMLVLIPGSPPAPDQETMQILQEHSHVGLRFISPLYYVLQFCLPLFIIILAWMGEYCRERAENA